MATVVILGGGVSGLAAAYYLQRNAKKLGKLIVLEGKKHTGGWISSAQHANGSVFEHGPRSIRPVGVSGRNTLQLVEELDLAKDVLVVHRSDAAARNRYLYVGGKLHPLPNNLKGLISKVPPFSKPLIRNFLGEPFAKRNTAPDESINSFFERRFGKEFADIAADALCRGIFAGDSRILSMKSCFPDIFKIERKHGSLILGMIISGRAKPQLQTTIEKRAKEERWASWSLRHGMQQITHAMTAAVSANPVCDVRISSPCQSLSLGSDGKIKVKTEAEDISADHVVSSIYANDLASLLPEKYVELRSALQSIPAVSVYVVNLEYPGEHIPVQGFGHLLPSSENPYVLGIVYDSCTFPEHNRKDKPSTRLTVMLGGSWFNKLLTGKGELPTLDTVAGVAKATVISHLGFPHDLQPSKADVFLLKVKDTYYFVKPLRGRE
ncbi:hypothetical protein C0Q70_20904 [Pomacea canaliculata]|uniref:Protoporphyrinogen oxidase n=1 Tax=Pomacea canaliculata TaxID=400727 RepID=A0A2T7NB10_POMCA|nr:hypothetical protein C0Q70_20904 [Pomacea canaliculata]